MSRNRLLRVLVPIGLVVASCLLEQGNAWQYSRRLSGPDFGADNIEIYHPKGIMVWYPYKKGIHSLRIEIYINKHHPHITLGRENCDMCVYTTEVSYGKFIVRNNDIIIRNGDSIQFIAIVQFYGVYAIWQGGFYVSDNHIMSMNISDPVSQPVAITSRPSENSQQTELDLLKQILVELKERCMPDGRWPTKELMLNTSVPATANNTELYQHTMDIVEQTFPSIDWNRTLGSAFEVGEGGIKFVVDTLIDKLKVLKLAQDHPDLVSDPDLQPIEERPGIVYV